MRFERLRVDNLRCLSKVELELACGLNVLVGGNGAGKTSVLESAFLLSHGRSFRSGQRDAMVRTGAERMSVFATVVGGDGTEHRVGLGRESGRWTARADGEELVGLGELFQLCAVVCFEPGSHALIAGGPEERRRFLDWGVFHVEHESLSTWRRYHRALKQRNRLLRTGQRLNDAEVEAWERELATSGESLDKGRARYIGVWQDELLAVASALVPELGAVSVSYRRGWSADESLAESLALRRERDSLRGHTTVGAHRCDWSLSFEGAMSREQFSRGQAKLAALACLLAQARVFARGRGEWPVLCLDDLASELDDVHLGRVVELVAGEAEQVLITGTALPQALRHHGARVFHVEQGQVCSLL